jgi:transposase
MTRALDPEVADAIWAAIEPILPLTVDAHPLGCHNPRVPDRVCFRGILIRLVTGASWVDIEAILNFEVSDTTLRGRRDTWIAAGVFDQLETEAREGYDRVLELNLDVVAIDGSLHKAPYGGEGTGKSPVDRGKLGWKWSVASERAGIPIGWAIDGANRNDVKMLDPTLDAVEANGLLVDIGTLTLDRSYDYPKIRNQLHARGLVELDIQRRGTKPPPGAPHRLTLGLRWIVEATNTWWSNYGQLRRSTDRKNQHRHAALQLATVVLIVGRLIDYRNRWSPA